MKKGLLTPLGKIQIYIDDILSDYEYQPHDKNIRSLQERPLAGCYQIVVSKQDWQTVRCVVSLCDTEISHEGASGERYLCSEFVKDRVVLTIGAGDENDAFETNLVPGGVEYVRRAPVERVVFGVAWATDYEGQFDIRTQLATDLY